MQLRADVFDWCDKLAGIKHCTVIVTAPSAKRTCYKIWYLTLEIALGKQAQCTDLPKHRKVMLSCVGVVRGCMLEENDWVSLVVGSGRGRGPYSHEALPNT